MPVSVGNVGAELFRLAKPFDMKFIAHDPFGDRKLAAELSIELVSLEDVFRRSDIVAVNCPLSKETHHLVNAERLALMKPTAYLINTARGPIIDQKALTKALQERRRRPGRAGAGTSRPSGPDPSARQRDPGAACPMLDRPVFCRERSRRREGGA